MAADAMKNSFSTVLPTLNLKAPRIRRAHLRKYSWLPDVFRIKGSVVGRITGPVLTVTVFAAIIAYSWERGYRIKLTNSIIPMLSVVVGLILVFRNGTSYDRFWEGRRSFAQMESNIRNLSRMIWINVCLPPTDPQPPGTKGKTPVSPVTASQLRRRKIDALKLCLSFAFAVKHYVRAEDGVEWEDFTDVLPRSFARFDDTGYTTQKTSLSNSIIATETEGQDSSIDSSMIRVPAQHRPSDATKRVLPKRNIALDSPSASTPLLADTHRTVEFHAYAEEVSLPLPLLIAHQLSSIIFHFRREGFLETIGPAGLNSMNSLVQSLVDQMTAMERVANTPIPASYRIHLKQAVTLYLFSLPFTLMSELGWATIPVVTVVAFTFMGIEGIAEEIEMPFGKDPSDLPLDRYCSDLKEEIFYIIDRLPEGGEGGYGYDDGEGDD